MENDIYESGQVRKFFPFVRPCVKQFILGGPADGDEAQLFHEVFPNVLVTGFEPHREFFKYQQRVNFPGMLYPVALWDKIGEHSFFEFTGNGGRGSRMGQGLTENWLEQDPGQSHTVPTATLDSMFHPAEEKSIALWIDIERAELVALKGARQLLEAGSFDVILVEAFDEMIDDIRAFLSLYSMREVARIIPGENVCNYIFWKF
jgi:FkbM family methyltransferase